MMYFGVALPAQAELAPGQTRVQILADRREAIQLLQSHKGGRFKACESRAEAERFAEACVLAEAGRGPEEAGGVEGCPHRSLTPQQLKGLKEAIQSEDERTFHALVDANPRYLTTPCDTPAILHSGTRANALHVAAQSGRMTRAVLARLEQPELMSRMYPHESGEMRARRREYLLDLYLNTPNKGHNDTPLHQAAKFGCVPVVRLLAQFSSCDSRRRNKVGLTPLQVACSRLGPGHEDLETAIEKALGERVYIPVIREVDVGSPGRVGPVWSPHAEGTPLGSEGAAVGSSSRVAFNSPRPNFPSPKFSPAASGPSPILLAQSPSRLSPMSIQALLGPLSPQDAELVQRTWKSTTPQALRLSNPAKGLETRGRVLAQEFETQLFEYWEFLGDYCDLRSPEGLKMLDDHLYDQATILEAQLKRERLRELDALMDEASLAHPTSLNPLSPVSQLTHDLDSLTLQSPVQSRLEREDSFESVPSSMGDYSRQSQDSDDSEVSFRTADEGLTLYIQGLSPSVADSQVYEVIRDVQVDYQTYPYIALWLESVHKATDQERAQWDQVSRGTYKKRVLRIPKLNFDLGENDEEEEEEKAS